MLNKSFATKILFSPFFAILIIIVITASLYSFNLLKSFEDPISASSPDNQRVVLIENIEGYIVLNVKNKETGINQGYIHTKASARHRTEVAWVSNEKIKLLSSDIGTYCWRLKNIWWVEEACNQDEGLKSTLNSDEKEQLLKSTTTSGVPKICKFNYSNSANIIHEGILYTDGKNRTLVLVNIFEGGQGYDVRTLILDKIVYVSSSLSTQTAKSTLDYLDKVAGTPEDTLPSNISALWDVMKKYDCTSWNIDETLFRVPTEYIDITEAMEQIKNSQDCSLCGNYQGEDAVRCKAWLQCK